MTSPTRKIVVTGATGHLGGHVIEQLLQRVGASDIAVAVRNVAKAQAFADRGIEVRRADYDQPDTLANAFRGAERVLLISANEPGKRLAQHRNVVDAVKAAGARLLVYTSILAADRSSIGLAKEHLATEELIRASGVPFVFLRNGWYLENYSENLGPALQHGAIPGSAGDGRIAAAAREDYAAAAVAVLASDGHEGRVYELAGDAPFTMSELAAEVSRQSGRTVVYRDLPPEEYRELLVGAGLPVPVAEMLVDADLGIRKGDLDSDSRDLQTLIGRRSTPLAEVIRKAVQA